MDSLLQLVDRCQYIGGFSLINSLNNIALSLRISFNAGYMSRRCCGAIVGIQRCRYRVCVVKFKGYRYIWWDVSSLDEKLRTAQITAEVKQSHHSFFGHCTEDEALLVLFRRSMKSDRQ